MQACPVGLVLPRPLFWGVVNSMQDTLLQMHCSTLQRSDPLLLMPSACQPDPIHKLQTNPSPQKPSALLSPCMPSPCGLSGSREGLQPPFHLGFSSALYSSGVSVPIGPLQACHTSYSQQQAAWLKLQPPSCTTSATLPLLILEDTYQRYLWTRIS